MIVLIYQNHAIFIKYQPSFSQNSYSKSKRQISSYERVTIVSSNIAKITTNNI